VVTYDSAPPAAVPEPALAGSVSPF
jgi:hypothetical protein